MTTPLKINTHAEADRALLDIGKLERMRQQITDEMNADIDRIKANAKVLIEPIDAKLKDAAGALELYVQANRPDLLGEKQSTRFTYGKVGFRKSARISPLPKCKVADILEALKKINAYDAINVKETIDRTALRQWDDARLHQVNARKVRKEVFYYEIAKGEVEKEVAHDANAGQAGDPHDL